MNPYASPQAYRDSAVLTASPEQLVVMLYDGAIRFLRQAEVAMKEGAWLHSFEKLSRGEAIIDELLATLNMDGAPPGDLRLPQEDADRGPHPAQPREDRPGRRAARLAARGVGQAGRAGRRHRARLGMSVFALLVALGREEHAAVTDGRWDDLAELNARRDRILAALPASAPPEAMADLREAVRLQALSAAALKEGLAETAAELRRVGTSRTAAAGYAAGTGMSEAVRPRASFDSVG
jgi:hypothetical protein